MIGLILAAQLTPAAVDISRDLAAAEVAREAEPPVAPPVPAAQPT